MWRLSLLSLLALAGAGCRSQPETLFQPCASDADCDRGLSCLLAEEPQFSGTPDSGAPREQICTRACSVDGDCPVQRECAGEGDLRRARCADGVCSVRVCD